MRSKKRFPKTSVSERRYLAFALIYGLIIIGCVGVAAWWHWPKKTRSLEIVELASLPPHLEPWTNADISSDGRLLALTDLRHLQREPISVVVWDISEKPSQVCAFDGPETICNALCFSPDGTLLAFGGNSGFVLIANIKEERIVHRFEIDGSPPSSEMGIDLRRVRCMEFSPDGQWLAVGTGSREVEIWATKTWMQLHTLPRHDTEINDLAFSRDGGYLLTAGEKREVTSDKTLLRLPEVFVFDTKTWNKTRECRSDVLPSYVRKATWLGDVIFALGDQLGNLVLINSSTMEIVAEFSGHRNSIVGLAFDAPRNLLISCSAEKSIVWDLETSNATAAANGAGFIAYEQQNSLVATAFGRDEKTARLLKIVEAK